MDEFRKVRLEKLKRFRTEFNFDPFKITKFKKSGSISELKDRFSHLKVEEEVPDKEFYVCGRVMAKRGHGRAGFCNIEDESGRVQLYVKEDVLGKREYKKYKLIDIGDIIGVKGYFFVTKTGELSLKVKELTLLSKALRPLPEKWHGLKDTEIRYRKRYLDLIMNKDVKETFRRRSRIINKFREILVNKGFLEVETPMMQILYGGAKAKPFITHHNALDMRLYLRIAPELYLKRLIVGGFEKVFELNKNFRNEGISIKHNPEFTMMELYQAYSDYFDMMDVAEELIKESAKIFYPDLLIDYEDTKLDFNKFERLSMLDAIKKYVGKDISGLNKEELSILLRELGGEVEDYMEKGHIINEIFEIGVEEKLINPTFIYDYPVEVSPLAKRKPDNPEFTERFELFIYGREVANAFSELNDPIDQKHRFEKQLKEREHGDNEAHQMDKDYIEALEYGMPPCGGLGIGIDRIVMLLTNSSSIRDVILFPIMRPIEKLE